jgi:glycerophosphoryl diester phosphodiesterase
MRTPTRSRLLTSLLVTAAAATAASVPGAAAAAPEMCGAVAHRGDFSQHTENSRPAARAAIAAGADYIEVDVRVTKDHKLVVMHDRTIGRTTDMRGAVAGMTLKRFKRATLDNGSKPPTLAQMLRTIKPSQTDVLVELKTMGGEATYRDLLMQLQQFGLERVWVESFSRTLLDNVASRDPDVRLAVITGQLLSPAQVETYDGVMVNNKALTDDAVALDWIGTMPKKVFIWTSNDAYAWRFAPYVTAVITDTLSAFTLDRATLCVDPA